MRYKLLTLLSNFVAVADEGKEQDASPVPQQKRYLEETHSSQSSNDRQSLPPGEPPPSERIKQGTFQRSVSIHRKEAAPSSNTVYILASIYYATHHNIGTKIQDKQIMKLE